MNPLTRRNFLQKGVLAGASAWMSTPAHGREERFIKTISLFHTTDLHGHILPTKAYDGIGNLGGLARCATQIRRWRQDSPDHLLFDIGDIYQGTIEGAQTKGQVMIDAFNKMNYDGWVLGNHEFDWGLDVVSSAIERSRMPVITGNVTIGDRKVGKINDGPFSKLAPWMIKDVGGFKIGIVGLVTPGIPFWSRSELLKEFGVLDPLAILQQSVRELQAEKVDAVVCLGHMGWKRTDDYANPVQNLLKEVRGIDVYIGGHTHQNQAAWFSSGVLCTQANYYGINCGRVDLSFDLESRKLVKRNAWTVLMDDRISLDPLIIESSKEAIESAEERRNVIIGEVTETLSTRGKTSAFWEILCRSFLDSAEKHHGKADLVFHGTFGNPNVQPGLKTIDDAWQWIPYENWLVHASLTGTQIREIISESNEDKYSDRALFGATPETLEPNKRYQILMNSYDSQSGGRRLMKLREIMAEKASNSRLLPINTREALINYFADHQKVSPLQQ